MADKEGDHQTNGTYWCPFSENWKAHRESVDDMMLKISETYDAMNLIHDDMKHLATISTTLATTSGTLSEIKAGLLNAVLGKDIVPVGVTQTLLSDQRKSYITIIKTLCWAFSVIIVILSGLRYVAPHLFGNPL